MKQDEKGLLVFPRLRIQNANAISSPTTWGFPSITAFMGLMWALERKVSKYCDQILFQSVGVVCHTFEPQVTTNGYVKTFNLTRNPVGKDGKARSFSEEGRAHLELTLVFSIDGGIWAKPDNEINAIVADIVQTLLSLRVAGGSIVRIGSGFDTPHMIRFDENPEKRQKQFRTLTRRWLPGSVLVLRQDLLEERHEQLCSQDSSTSIYDAWLDLSRLSWSASNVTQDHGISDSESKNTGWTLNTQEGWIVPIPIGYGAISNVHPAGSVENARDNSTDFRFVESLYSIGQWISAHRLSSAQQMLWYNETDSDTGLYTCKNNYSEKSLRL